MCLQLRLDLVVAHIEQNLTMCNAKLEGQSPQICTVSHGRTFEYQNFSNFRYAIFQYKSQKWMPKDDLSV